MKVKTHMPKLMGSSKAVLTGTSIVINAYVRKKERSQINNLTLHVKELEKGQISPKLV